MAQTKPKAGQFYGVSDNGTDGQFLKTDGTGGMSWDSPITNPTITSIDYPGTQTAADPAGGESVIINGTLFASGITCTVGGTSAVTAFNSATQITITTPAKAAGQYTVAVTNPDGGTVSQANFIQYSGVPVWSTASGNIGSVQSGSTASFQVTATEGSDTIEYAVTTGTLPTGLSLATATGAITGTAGSVSASTTTTFSITATDDENQTSSARSFNITVTPDLPSNHFTPVIWSGNGSSTRSISTGFESDMIWIKSRNYVNNHFLLDSVRGKDGGTTYENVYPNLNSAQANDSGITAIGSTSFTTGSSRYASNDWVAWAWKAGGAPVANTDGTITSQVSANTTLGFSISKYTGNGTSGATFGHGLGSQVNISMVKRTDSTGYWYVYSSFLSANNNLYLNTSDAQQADGVMLGGNTTTVSISASSSVNASGGEYIAYNFASKPGFSKVDYYAGNGTTSHIIQTGFEPAFLMIKGYTHGGGWVMLDNKRNSSNPRDNVLYAEASGAEQVNDIYAKANFLSNGFELLTNDSGINMSGRSYIYLAIAADGSTTTPSLANSFNAETYSGTNSAQSTNSLSNQSGTISFKPDLIWFKNRTGAYPYQIYNSIRGVNKFLNSGVATTIGGYTGTGAEFDDSGYDLMSYDSNGFTLGASGFGSVNESGFNSVAWSWKAGGLASINTAGSITSLVAANQAAGFSIVNYTGESQSSATIGHGLSSAPEMYIVKSLSTGDWWTYNKYLNGGTNPANYFIRLNSTAAESLNSGSPPSIFAGTEPTSTVFSIGASINTSNGFIAYCFTSIPGYSKVGTYTGSNASGKVVTTGFQPSYLLVKSIGHQGMWAILDDKRTTGANGKNRLYANGLWAEDSAVDVQFTATGFTILTSNSDVNGNYTYIYLAIKEN